MDVQNSQELAETRRKDVTNKDKVKIGHSNRENMPSMFIYHNVQIFCGSVSSKGNGVWFPSMAIGPPAGSSSLTLYRVFWVAHGHDTIFEQFMTFQSDCSVTMSHVELGVVLLDGPSRSTVLSSSSEGTWHESLSRDQSLQNGVKTQPGTPPIKCLLFDTIQEYQLWMILVHQVLEAESEVGLLGSRWKWLVAGDRWLRALNDSDVPTQPGHLLKFHDLTA